MDEEPAEKAYGIILEWKDEQPLVMEGAPMTYEQAYNRMKQAVGDSRVIRAAMFRMTCVSGNETLLPKENDNG